VSTSTKGAKIKATATFSTMEQATEAITVLNGYKLPQLGGSKILLSHMVKVTNSIERSVLERRDYNFICEAEHLDQEEAQIARVFRISQFLRVEPLSRHLALIGAVLLQVHASCGGLLKGALERLFKEGWAPIKPAFVEVMGISLRANVDSDDRAVKTTVRCEFLSAP
jgi:hypothetical protein